MNIRKLSDRLMGWCPGYENASRLIPDKDVSDKVAAVSFLAVLVTIIFSGTFSGVFRFIVILFTALIAVPVCWNVLREDKAGDQEHTYRDPSVKPVPSERFGEFKIEGPSAEIGIYGPTRSSDGFYTGLTINREWLHPDNVWYMEHLDKKKSKTEKKRA
jgi:hypothetical protein